MVYEAINLVECGSVCKVKGRGVWPRIEGGDGGPAHIVKMDPWLSSARHMQSDQAELLILSLQLLVPLSMQTKEDQDPVAFHHESCGTSIHRLTGGEIPSMAIKRTQLNGFDASWPGAG